MRFPQLTRLAFSLLAGLKFLRGSVIDPFKYLAERKEERETLEEYKALFAVLAEQLDGDNHAAAVALAELPMEIRGYGHIKSANLVKAKARKDILLRQFRGELLAVAVDVGEAA